MAANGSNIPAYTNIADIKKYWLENIAPNYFGFDNINNYQLGIFGYINEIMANTTEDVFNAVNIARREFYPNTAMYKQSLFQMAVMQKITTPVSTAATAKAILIIPEKEVVERGTSSNGVHTCVIDNSMTLMADNIPFLLDFPIIILSKRKGDKWIHTSHYDINEANSLVTLSNKYIVNKTVLENGNKYLFLAVTLRQLRLTTSAQLVVKDNAVDTATMDFGFDGSLANFEVFYKDGESKTTQLKKVLKNGAIPQQPFCYYDILDNDSIRLIFPKNAYFSPTYNSEITMRIYTSEGDSGNFEMFKGSMTANVNSDKYPYNNTMTITGIINGASVGGKNMPSDDDFRALVMNAYATNNTITSSNDLQIYFDQISLNNNQRSRIVFRKKRDDAAYRIFGAYSLLKDSSNNVVPTNTLNITLTKDQLDPTGSGENRLIIKPGTVFEYKPNAGGNISYDAQLSDIGLMDDLEKEEKSKFLFTNPFLIAVSLDPNIVGYYLNSVNQVRAVEYLYVNDNSLTQFIASNFKVSRNAMLGENYYKLSLIISPASEIDPKELIEVAEAIDENSIRAKMDGRLMSTVFTEGKLIATIKYVDDTIEEIVVNNRSELIDSEFVFRTGYKLQFGIGDTFIANDILAIKNATDLGKLRAALDIKDMLLDNGMYIPMYIEEYDKTLNAYTINAYISTTDIMSTDGRILIESGILNADASPNANVAIPMNKLNMNINVFYKNDDANLSHKYSDFIYYKNYTLVNTYSQNSNDPNEKIALIQQIDFIRSILKFVAGSSGNSSWSINLSEVPVARASWARNAMNFKYLIDNIYSNYLTLYDTYFLLENNWGIELGFFNTYGKSRFFKVGLKENMSILDNVNCSFKFGVFLTSLNSPELFIAKFRDYVKNYVESVNYVSSNGQSIYMMNLIADATAEFPEIGYSEYYGFNKYDESTQKIEGLSSIQVEQLGDANYIPEFINVMAIQDGDNTRPDIDVHLLDS